VGGYVDCTIIQYFFSVLPTLNLLSPSSKMRTSTDTKPAPNSLAMRAAKSNDDGPAIIETSFKI
jgi:hypothetical protein